MQNLLQEEDVLELYKYSYFRRDKPLGLLRRVIFNMVFISSWEPGILANLEMHQLRKTMPNMISVFRLRRIIADNGISKTVKGGLRDSYDKPIE